MSWIKNIFERNRPLHYPRLLSIYFFRDAKILNTNTPLYKDYKEAYENYILKYKSYEREEKLKELGL